MCVDLEVLTQGFLLSLRVLPTSLWGGGKICLNSASTVVSSLSSVFFIENSPWGGGGGGGKWKFLVLRGGKVNLVCSILCTSNTGFLGEGEGGSGVSFPQVL